ncbi:NUMOD4 domain-containing protein [Jeotgalibaca porci]|uniref:NUMOD4 domain-containing protein n=1 Tax=Jeotgalibaca porci TaxID=1868793 RepID=UPI00359F27BE
MNENNPEEYEVWKDVVGYEGLYKVSNKGNVYSVERKNSRGRKIGGRILKPTNSSSYLKLFLYKNGMRKNKYVHRLVAEAFIPNHNKYLEINHKDEDTTNNHVENLEWCTREHNINHGKRTEKVRQKQSKRVKGVNVETGEVITFKSTMEARRKGYFAVSKACRGIYKSADTGKLIGDGRTYKGHKWSYEEERSRINGR